MSAEGIVECICCVLCGLPFLIMGHFNKNSVEPITFWSGDKTLKEKLKDIQGYNSEII